MAVVKRIAHLIKADLHAALDYLEEPTAVLRQAIRDMEAHLSNEVQRRERTHTLRRDLAGTLDRLTRRLDELDAELDVCFTQQEEELARAVIRQKLTAEAEVRQTRDAIRSLDDNLRTVDERLSDRRNALTALKQRAELLACAAFEPEEERSIRGRPSVGVRSVSEADVGIAYLKERESRRGR